MKKRRRSRIASYYGSIRVDIYMADYEWLALRDLAATLDWSKTRTLLEGLERLSEDALGYNLVELYAKMIDRPKAAKPSPNRKRQREEAKRYDPHRVPGPSGPTDQDR